MNRHVEDLLSFDAVVKKFPLKSGATKTQLTNTFTTKKITTEYTNNITKLPMPDGLPKDVKTRLITDSKNTNYPGLIFGPLTDYVNNYFIISI